MNKLLHQTANIILLSDMAEKINSATLPARGLNSTKISMIGNASTTELMPKQPNRPRSECNRLINLQISRDATATSERPKPKIIAASEVAIRAAGKSLAAFKTLKAATRSPNASRLASAAPKWDGKKSAEKTTHDQKR